MGALQYFRFSYHQNQCKSNSNNYKKLCYRGDTARRSVVLHSRNLQITAKHLIFWSVLVFDLAHSTFSLNSATRLLLIYCTDATGACLAAWTRRWVCRLDVRLNVLWQTTQTNGRMAVCVRRWRVKFPGWRKARPHWSHVKGFSPVCILCQQPSAMVISPYIVIFSLLFVCLSVRLLSAGFRLENGKSYEVQKLVEIYTSVT